MMKIQKLSIDEPQTAWGVFVCENGKDYVFNAAYPTRSWAWKNVLGAWDLVRVVKLNFTIERKKK